MRDDDGMDRLADKVLALEACGLIGILVVAASAKGGSIGMKRPSSVFLRPSDKAS